MIGDVLAGLVGQQAHKCQLGGHALGADGLIVVGELSDTTATRGGQRQQRTATQCRGKTEELSSAGQDTHLSATVDSLTKPDVLHALCASEPILLSNALRLCVDAGLAGGKVAEDFDGIVVAALVGVDPVESCTGKTQ